MLLKQVNQAYRCFDALVAGRVGSVGRAGSREGISDRYLSRLLPLALLTPKIARRSVHAAGSPLRMSAIVSDTAADSYTTVSREKTLADTRVGGLQPERARSVPRGTDPIIV